MARGPSLKLTIAIPTFDRAKELGQTLATILPQLTDDVELVVVDNASPNLEVVRELGDSRVRVVRNPANIGANGNVLRCFEVSDAEWLWLLGDDDNPRNDAVKTVLRAIDSSRDALAINFCSAHGTAATQPCTSGREELIRKLPAFGNLLFISTNVYRRAPLVEQLHVGYRFAYSMAPHVAMLLMAIGTTGSVVFSEDAVVDTETRLDGSHWSAINQSLSIPVLLELPLTPPERKRLAARFQLPDLINLLIQLLGTGVRRGEFQSSKFYYRQITGRLWPYTPLTRRFGIWAGYMAFVLPKVSLALLDRVLAKHKGSSVMQRLRAETIDPRM